MEVPSDSKILYEDYIKSGKECLKNNELKKALNILHKAMEITPLPNTLYYISKAYVKSLNESKAIPYLHNALTQLVHTNHKEDVKVKVKFQKMLYEIYKKLNNFTLAIKVLKELESSADKELELLKRRQVLREEKAKEYMVNGLKNKELIKCYTASLKEVFDYNLLLDRAYCYMKIEDYKNTINDCTKYLEEFKFSYNAFILRGTCYFYLEHFKKSFADFERAKQCSKEHSIERTNAELYLSMAKERFHSYNQLKKRTNINSQDITEEDSFVLHMIKTQKEHMKEGEVWHAISSEWYKKWNERKTSNDGLPPIVNKDILSLLPFSNYNEHQYRKQQIRKGKEENKDFLWVQDGLWKYWEKKYGGIDIKRYCGINIQWEAYFIRTRIVFKPRRYWIKKEVEIYLSKNDSYESIKEQCDRINEEFMKAENVNIDRSNLKSRIWIIEDSNSIRDLDKRINKAKISSKEIQIEVKGYLLKNKAINKDNIILLVELIESTGQFIFKQEYNDKSLAEIIPKKANGGVIGLINNWNICYVNSSLQCLSNCQELTTYFLSGRYEKELNRDNLLGFRGLLAEYYAELLHEMWKSDCRIACALDLKTTIASKFDQFRGAEQHDSQEFLLHLLDGMHEDLNRVLKKSYIENSEPNTRPDSVVSQEQWEKYLMRNDSIVTDLFAGQYKSHVICPLCNNVSITFDPFTILSIPIPSTILKEVIYVPYDISKRCIKLRMTVSETSTLLSLAGRLSRALKLPSNRTFSFRTINHKQLTTELDMEMPLNEEGVGELYVYECLKEDKDFLEVKLFCEKTLACIYPLLIPVNEDMLIAEIKKKIFEKLIPILSNKQNIDALCNEYIEVEKPLFVITIYNNRPLDSSSYFRKKYVDCEFCDNPNHKDNCILSFPYDQFTLGELREKIEYERDLVLAVQFKQNIKEFRDHFKNMRYAESSSIAHVSLMDCFEHFVEEEQLDSDNMWYCKRCQKNVQANKQIEFFRLPKILIIHLKRFKSRIFMGSYLAQSKNNEFIDYPTHNFDLSQILKGKQRAIYDLFGVVMHYGMLQGGHYTATCFNPIKNKWLDFDDSDVTEAGNIVDKAGYVLFYRQQN